MRFVLCGLLMAVIAAAASSVAAEISPKTNEQPIRVALLLYDGVQVLDVAGPLEVFTGTTVDRNGKRAAAFDVYMVAEHLKPVKANNTARIYMPQHTLSDAPPPQIVIVPGGDTAGAEANLRLIEAIRQWSKTAELTASVCTGAFLLARAGLLEKKPATTHWYFLDRLAKEFPTIDVKRDVRFVDSGNVMTAAGISAGIDMALAIVERYYGGEAAKHTARVMQYESRPPSP